MYQQEDNTEAGNSKEVKQGNGKRLTLMRSLTPI